MNYFAHGRGFLDQPFMVAGVSLPDWLNVVDRKIRVRSRHATPHVEDDDPTVADFARGVVQHHHDDHWFHQTRAFVETSLAFAQQLRELLPDDQGMRPSFLGHILVELLLDSVLIQESPEQLDRYYAVMDELPAERVASIAERLAGKPIPGLARFIPLFCRERFLYDYQEDEKLLKRINRVLVRVRLSTLPSTVLDFFATARCEVARRRDELLAEPLADSGAS